MDVYDKSNLNSSPALVLPVVFIKSRVVFPHTVVPIYIKDQKIINDIEKTTLIGSELYLVTRRSVVEPDGYVFSKCDCYQVGTVGLVISLRKLSDGRLKLLVQGLYRASILDVFEKNDQYKAKFIKVSDKLVEASPEKIKIIINVVRTSLNKIVGFGKILSPNLMVILEEMKDPGKFADMIASHLNIKSEAAQALLEMTDPIERLSKVHHFLCQEIEEFGNNDCITSNFDNMYKPEEIDKTTKLKFSKKTLIQGVEKDQDELDELWVKLRKIALAPKIFSEISRSFQRLKKMPRESSESLMLRNFMEVFLSIPWGRQTKENLNLKEVEEILNKEHFGLFQVKDRILEYLAVKRLNPKAKSPIICFVGPPGVGKTSLGRSIAIAIGRNFSSISLGGIRDEAEIRGHRRTYVGAYPGRIVQSIKNADSFNPVIMLDEIDKLGNGQRGCPAAALLEVLDSEQNSHFIDHYLGVPCDLSKVLFIANANCLETISAALKDRLEIIEVSGYSDEEKVRIAGKFIFKRIVEECGLNKYSISITEESLFYIIRYFTQESGLREIERQLSIICRKIARQIAEEQHGSEKEFKLTVEKVKEYLCVENIKHKELVYKNIGVGVALAMAYTNYGGEILPVETLILDGQGRLVLTGQLGKVMQESAQTAFSYLKLKHEMFGFKSLLLKNKDIHIHIPQGALPKEGPSAGIAIATSILSSLRGEIVREGFCMTGEITLHGKVLPVGGVKEKVLAAQRSGLHHIIFSKYNRINVESLPSDILDKINVFFVSEYEEIFKLLFLDKERNGRENNS